MNKKLLLKLVVNDIRKNKLMSAILILLIFLSALLMAGGLRVTGNMLSSVKGMNEIALPPDFLKMHKGEFDSKQVESFNQTHSYIQMAQTVKMLNLGNANILYKSESFEESMMDNSFIVQNTSFDFLLNTENKIARVKEGEIGVPVFYVEKMGILIGDSITLKSNTPDENGNYERLTLKVTQLIRDAQMNSALASSKRFLISKEDMEKLAEYGGEWEYSFEYKLKTENDVASLEKDYIEEKMPANGVAITGKIITLLNTLSYGVTALLILFMSFLLMGVATLCISCVIRATMVEENKNIATMKAIGFAKKDIERLYLIKYVAFVLAAGVISYFVAIPLASYCGKSVLLYCGEGKSQWMGWCFPVIGEAFLMIMAISRCRRMIRKTQKSSVMELIRGESRKNSEGHFKLPMNGWKQKNIVMAAGELKCKWKEYPILVFVFAVAAFLFILPINVKNTIQNPTFITYMGIGKCDIRVDIEHNEKMKEQEKALTDYLKTNNQIADFVVFESGYIQLLNQNNEWEYIRTTSGDESVFPLHYLEGAMPKSGQIALSSLQAKQGNKTVGDRVTIKVGEQMKKVTISGIYQDITYGGKTAKAPIIFSQAQKEGYTIYIDLNDKKQMDIVTKKIKQIVPQNKVTPIEEFVEQTMSGIVGNLNAIETAAGLLALFLVALITAMFLQLIIVKEHSAVAIKKSLGFTNRDISTQYGIRMVVLQLMGIIVGTLLANLLGESLFGMALSGMGAEKITLLMKPLQSYLVCPILQLMVAILTVDFATKSVHKYHIRMQIAE